MRLFTAIELPAEVRDALAEAQSELKKRVDDRISLVAPKTLHVTLKFLGEVGDNDVLDIYEELKTISSPAFSIEVSQLGALPPHGKARVLIAEVSGQIDALQVLFESIEAACEPLGFACEQRKFHPHITLARMRIPKRISCEVEELKLKQMAPFQVHEFVLMQSTLSSAGSHYQPVARFSLSR